MKRYIVLFLLLGLAVLAYANPIMVYPIQAMWFTTNDEAIFQFSQHMDNAWAHEVSFSSGGDFYPLPDNISIDYPHYINASQVFPQLGLERESGTLYFRFEEYEAYQFTWGQGNEVDLRPLLPGQAAMIIEGGNGLHQGYTWVKCSTIPSPIEGPQDQDAVQLNIHVQLENGVPATGVPIYYDLNNWSAGSTDEAGNFQRLCYPARCRFRVKDPLTEQWIYDTVNYPEPGDTLNIVVTVSGTANQDPIAPAAFRIYPNVLRSTEGTELRIECEKTPGAESFLELYDLRGRRLESRVFNGSGTYQLSDLGMGIYFLKLTDNGRVLGSRKILVLE